MARPAWHGGALSAPPLERERQREEAAPPGPPARRLPSQDVVRPLQVLLEAQLRHADLRRAPHRALRPQAPDHGQGAPQGPGLRPPDHQRPDQGGIYR